MTIRSFLSKAAKNAVLPLAVLAAAAGSARADCDPNITVKGGGNLPGANIATYSEYSTQGFKEIVDDSHLLDSTFVSIVDDETGRRKIDGNLVFALPNKNSFYSRTISPGQAVAIETNFDVTDYSIVGYPELDKLVEDGILSHSNIKHIQDHKAKVQDKEEGIIVALKGISDCGPSSYLFPLSLHTEGNDMKVSLPNDLPDGISKFDPRIILDGASLDSTLAGANITINNYFLGDSGKLSSDMLELDEDVSTSGRNTKSHADLQRNNNSTKKGRATNTNYFASVGKSNLVMNDLDDLSCVHIDFGASYTTPNSNLGAQVSLVNTSGIVPVEGSRGAPLDGDGITVLGFADLTSDSDLLGVRPGFSLRGSYTSSTFTVTDLDFYSASVAETDVNTFRAYLAARLNIGDLDRSHAYLGLGTHVGTTSVDNVNTEVGHNHWVIVDPFGYWAGSSTTRSTLFSEQSMGELATFVEAKGRLENKKTTLEGNIFYSDINPSWSEDLGVNTDGIKGFAFGSELYFGLNLRGMDFGKHEGVGRDFGSFEFGPFVSYSLVDLTNDDRMSDFSVGLKLGFNPTSSK